MNVPPKVRWAAAAAAVAMAAGAWWSCTRRPNLERDAKSIVDAVLDGDSDAYFAYISDVEIERFGLTRPKVRQLFDKLVIPALGGFERVSSPLAGSNGDHQAYHYVMLQNARGQRWEIHASPFLGEGAGMTSISHVIHHAWVLDFVVKKDLPVTAATAIYARTRGVPRDREFLESLGITGRVDETDPSKYNDWATYLRWSDQMCRTQFADELRSLGIQYQPANP